MLLNYINIVLFLFAESLFMKQELLSFFIFHFFSFFFFFFVEFPLMLPRPSSLGMYNMLCELNEEQEVVGTNF